MDFPAAVYLWDRSGKACYRLTRFHCSKFSSVLAEVLSVAEKSFSFEPSKELAADCLWTKCWALQNEQTIYLLERCHGEVSVIHIGVCKLFKNCDIHCINVSRSEHVDDKWNNKQIPKTMVIENLVFELESRKKWAWLNIFSNVRICFEMLYQMLHASKSFQSSNFLLIFWVEGMFCLFFSCEIGRFLSLFFMNPISTKSVPLPYTTPGN